MGIHKKEMMMSDEEIVKSYKESKYPPKQVAILAELNACSTAKIRQILKDGGVELTIGGHRPTSEELEDIEKGNIKWTPQGLIKAEANKKPPKEPTKTNKAPAAAGQEAESLSNNHTSELIEPTKASEAAGHIIPDAVVRLIEYRLDEIEATIKRCEHEYTELSNYLKGV